MNQYLHLAYLLLSKLNISNFNYKLNCTEICGRGHYAMRYILVVDEPEDYQKWLATQEPWLKVNPDYISKVPERLRSLLPFELAPAKTETPASKS